jgi:DNA-binding transcriptional MerR regulator
MEKDGYGQLDLEWVQLIKEALALGLEKEEISRFLKSKNKNALAAGS